MVNELKAYAYCIEDISNIENYEAALKDPNETWVCHHRLAIQRRNGKERVTRLSAQDLIDWHLYFHRPASELIFLTHAEHYRIHSLGNKHNKGRDPWNKGKHLSDEHKLHLSESHKHKSSGFWFNNGVKNTRAMECPEGFKPGRIR